jgi:DNA polymerase-3 subunit beta
MKLSCLQENLARGLSIVSRAVSPRSTLPVLGNVLIATEGGRLKLSATNLELGITYWIGAKVEEEGSTTVPARTFLDLVNALPADTVREIIGQVVFAASGDDARPVLTGVLLEVDGDVLTLAAADGFRLSVRNSKLSKQLDEPVRAIIPARALSELSRILSGSKGADEAGAESVSMVLPANRSQVVFRAKNVELVSQLIDGTFPDYEGIIPTSYATRSVLPTTPLLNACKAADIFAREAAHSARLSINPGGETEPGTVKITAISAETGSNETVVDATIEGEAVEIAFNVRFLVEVLSVIDTPNVSLETTSPSSPGMLKPVGRDDFLHVVMPMHLGR